MKNTVEIIITRHPALVAYLIEQGIVTSETPVLAHAGIGDIKGKRVVGILPHHLSQHCASITEVPMKLSRDDREAMQAGDLSLERVREVAGKPITYQVFGGSEDQRAVACIKAGKARQHWDPDHFLSCVVRDFAAMLANPEREIWGYQWADYAHRPELEISDSSKILRRAWRSVLAARGQITEELQGTRPELAANRTKIGEWSMHGGHFAAEADPGSGRFRAFASGPGWTPWIDVDTLELTASE